KVVITLSKRDPLGELAFYPHSHGTAAEMRPEHNELASVFRTELSRIPQATIYPDGKTVCFTKLLILTARPRSLTGTEITNGELGGQIAWSNPRIVGVGTARTDTQDGESEAKMM